MKSLAVITLDSVRYDQIIAADTPFLDSLGTLHPARSHADGTFPSHMALLSGNLNWPDFVSNKSYRCGPWMSSFLRKRGYTTVGAASLPWVREDFFGRGFDSFFAMPLGTEGAMMPLPKMLRDVERIVKVGTDIRKEPIFLFLNIGETHFPYTVAMKAPRQSILHDLVNNPESIAPSVADSMKRDQQRTISWVDARLGEFFEGRDDWIVYISSDHGELFGEHGLWIHGHGCYEEEVSVFAVCNDWEALVSGDFE